MEKRIGIESATNERRLSFVEALYALHGLSDAELVMFVGGRDTQRPIAMRGRLDACFELGRESDGPVCFQLGELVLALSERAFVTAWIEESTGEAKSMMALDVELAGGVVLEFLPISSMP